MACINRDGRFLSANDAFCRIVGRRADALLGASLPDVAAPEDKAALDQALGNVLDREEHASLDMRCARLGGAPRWVSLDLAPTKLRDPHSCIVVVAAGDGDRAKRLAAALRESEVRRERLVRERQVETRAHSDIESRLQLALDAARMGTWTWDPINDVATHDARALEILGGTSEELSYAAALANHLPPDSASRYAQGLQRVLDPASGDNHFEEEFRWRRGDGERIWIQMTGQARFEGEGDARRVVHLAGTIVDITERKFAEDALADAGRQKDRFLATLAHELRNPLAPLCYAAELLRRQSREELDWARGVIERQVTHLSRLIDDLLDISRITRDQLELRLERIVLGDVLHAAVESSQASLDEHEQELIVQQPAEAIFVVGDFVRLTQVFTNLLRNAAKFTSRPNRVWLSVERDDAEVRVSVRDAGIGIPAEELPHVFEMFYQGTTTPSQAQSGLGVGLYLVRRLVGMHGGAVEARSDGDGRGSEFIVHLPVAPAAGPAKPASILPETGAEDAHPAMGRRVLVVDDNRDSADALAKLLQAAGHDVRTAYEGWAALESAAQFKPEFVLLDLGMPTIDGYDVCRRLRGQDWGEAVRIVALTGWGRAEDRARAREAGFDDHLVKPISFAAVQSLLSSRNTSLN